MNLLATNPVVGEFLEAKRSPFAQIGQRAMAIAIVLTQPSEPERIIIRPSGTSPSSAINGSGIDPFGGILFADLAVLSVPIESSRYVSNWVASAMRRSASLESWRATGSRANGTRDCFADTAHRRGFLESHPIASSRAALANGFPARCRGR